MDKSIYTAERIRDSHPLITISLSTIVREFYSNKVRKPTVFNQLKK